MSDQTVANAGDPYAGAVADLLAEKVIEQIDTAPVNAPEHRGMIARAVSARLLTAYEGGDDDAR